MDRFAHCLPEERSRQAYAIIPRQNDDTHLTLNVGRSTLTQIIAVTNLGSLLEACKCAAHENTVPEINILIDVSRLLSRMSNGLLPTGVDRVGLAYVERYQRSARAVLSKQGFAKILSERNTERIFGAILDRSRSREEVGLLIARSLLIPNRERFEHAILLHTSHNGMEHVRYYRAMRRHGARLVFMVHDLIPLSHAEYCRPGIEARHRHRIHTALRMADGLISNSHETLASLEAEARRAGLTLPPSVVAPLAPGITSIADGPPPLATPYFVMLGTIEPRKNHWLMLHVWRRLVETFGEQAPRLVIIGRRGWECENVVDMLERCEPLQGMVIEEAHCTDGRLRMWLSHAQALLFPSFAEGYGMPLVEALLLGIPVLASDLSVFREIAGDIPDYLDPLDGPGWAARICAYARRDSNERSAQCVRALGFRAPTWQEHFERVDHFLATLPT